MSAAEIREMKESETETSNTYWFGENGYKGKHQIRIPVKLGNIEVLLQTVVVEGDIPWLIGTEVLKKIEAIIDFGKMEMKGNQLLKGESIKVTKDKKGHLRIKLRERKKENSIWFNLRKEDLLENKEKWKKSCVKLHFQFGHCSYNRLKDMVEKCFREDMDFQRVRKEKMETLKQICEACLICKKYKKNPSSPVVGMALAHYFNEVIALDIGELEGEKFLVIIDWATRYCQAKWIKNKKPEEMIEVVMDRWLSIFGAPRKILTDGGREFQNDEFVEFTDSWGIELLSTASDSPWSNGKCEKMVGIIKECLIKMKEEKIGNKKRLLNWIVCAKNETIMDDGFSPHQKVFGINSKRGHRDEENTPGELERGFEGRKLRELMTEQEQVMEKVHSFDCKNRIKKALSKNIRHHKIEEADIGDKVFFKKKNEKRWRGPGKVIGREGKTVWVRHGGTLKGVNKVHITRIQKLNSEPDSEEEDSTSTEEEEDNKERSERNRHLESDNSEDERESSMVSCDEISRDEEDVEDDEDERLKDASDLRIGRKYQIRRDDEWRPILILSLGGKRKGKYDGAYNIRDLRSGEEKWLDLRHYEIIEGPEELDVEENNIEEEEETALVEGEVMYYGKMKETGVQNRIQEAKEKELGSWKENKVYEEVKREEGLPIIKTRWIVSQKEIDGGVMWKARLVARGFMEKLNEECVACEAPTVSAEGLKILLIIMKMYRWQVRALDVKTAYLQGKEIKREVFLEPPKEAQTNKVWKLHKAVYGLKDAARKWYETLGEILMEIGGKRSKVEKTIYYWRREDQLIGIMGTHVDDLIFGGTDEFHDEIMKELEKRLKIGAVNKGKFKYLGIELEDNKGGISMSQNSYVNKKIREVDIRGRKFDEVLIEEDQTKYRSLLGSLNWLAQHTRPDLSFQVSKLGRNLQSASYGNMREINRVVKITKERNVKVFLERLEKGKLTLEVFADASFGNMEDGKTQIGFCILLRDKEGRSNPIIWKSKLSRRVVGSTLAGETMSVIEGTEWAEYLKYLWEEINGVKTEDDRIRIVVKTDCRSLKENIRSETGVKNRMLRIDLLNLKSKFEEGIIQNIEWINNRDQLADGLTKEKSNRKLGELVKEVGRY